MPAPSARLSTQAGSTAAPSRRAAGVAGPAPTRAAASSSSCRTAAPQSAARRRSPHAAEAAPPARHSTRRGIAVSATAGTPGHLPAKELLQVALKAAEAGADVVRAALDKPRTISFKGATDLVTETDGASEAAILDVLRAAYPGHAVLGEEGGVSGDTASDYLWCVDPLDGTTNFAHGYPSFGVSVAVLRRATPVAGVVVEFAGGPGAWVTKTYAASRNGGATLNGKAISVSRVADVTKSLLVTGFGYEHDAAWKANMALFQHYTDVSQGVRRLGAASVDMCHVALGVVDAYWEYRLKPWDVAAGVLIVEEAGGRVSTMDGLPYSVFQRSVLVSNESLHDALLARMDPATAELREAGVDLSPWFVPQGYGVHTGAQL